jgi:hypothetical protein
MFMFMTAWVFEALHCPTLLNEIKKTELDSNTEPQAGINILLVAVWPSPHFIRSLCPLSPVSYTNLFNSVVRLHLYCVTPF